MFFDFSRVKKRKNRKNLLTKPNISSIMSITKRKTMKENIAIKNNNVKVNGLSVEPNGCASSKYLDTIYQFALHYLGLPNRSRDFSLRRCVCCGQSSKWEWYVMNGRDVCDSCGDKVHELKNQLSASLNLDI